MMETLSTKHQYQVIMKDPEKTQDPAGIRTQDLLITSQTLMYMYRVFLAHQGICRCSKIKIKLCRSELVHRTEEQILCSQKKAIVAKST